MDKESGVWIEAKKNGKVIKAWMEKEKPLIEDVFLDVFGIENIGKEGEYIYGSKEEEELDGHIGKNSAYLMDRKENKYEVTMEQVKNGKSVVELL